MGVAHAEIRSQLLRTGHYERLLLAMLAPLTLLRWLIAANFELCGDEAYYWLWSRHLDIAYYSKGPAVAAVIALSTYLFGDTALGVRAFVPVFAAATTVGVFVLGRMLYDSRTGFWAAMLLTVMPMSAVGALLQTTDPISICCWTWSLVLLARIATAPSLALWAGAGLLIGVGALAKYTNLALVPSFLLFCAVSRRHRALFRAPGLALMLLVVLLCLAPVLAWESHHGWVTMTHLRERGALGVTPRLSPREFAVFTAMQLAVSWPILAGVAWAVIAGGSLWQDMHEPGFSRLAFLLTLSLPLLLSYAAMAWVKAGEPNWVAPSYIGLVVVAAAAGVRHAESSGGLRWRSPQLVCVGVAAALNLGICAVPFVPLPGDASLLSRIDGAQQLATRVARVKAGSHAAFVIGEHYQIASLLAFYSPDHPRIFTPTQRLPQDEFFYWPGYQQTQRQGQNALYVALHNEVPQDLQDEFARVRLLQVFTPRFGAQSLRPYYLFLCEAFRRSARS